ncbi:MAG: arabinan endo-1,5-alpha-L-arabinosidase [Bacilli bacterium]
MQRFRFLVSIVVLALTACGVTATSSETSVIEAAITYPAKPYSDDDHIMKKDPYAFYNIAGNDTRYWGSANTHDPAIIKESDYYYAFSTDANIGVTSQKGIHIRKSSDLIHWDFMGTALDLPSLQDGFDYVGYDRDGTKVDICWAPDIIKRGNEFWLYYSISGFGQRNSLMGVAKSLNIEGPYVHAKEILRTSQSVGGTPNAIDPAIFVEKVGGVEKMYMSYGSWSAGIYIIELDPATGYPLIAQSLVEREVTVNTAEPGVTATETKLVPSSADDPAFGTKILSITSSEAPYIIKENGYYYLFITNGVDLTYDYDARVFRATNILGPYVDGKGVAALSSTNYHSFRPYGNKVTIAHQFTYNDDDINYKRGWAAIGHSTAFKDNGEWFFASHYRGTYMDRHRFFLGVWKMHFINDWPVLEPNRYTGEGSIDLEKADISGNYRIQILHQSAVNSALTDDVISIVKRAEAITLTTEKDGDWYLVSGEYSGRYRINEGLLELELDGTLYSGRITPQFNYEFEEGVLGLSLINDEGTALWGNRIG